MAIKEDLLQIINWALKDHHPHIHRIHVMGHDWGAVLAYLLAAHHPDKVSSLVTMAVPHNAIYGFNAYPWQVSICPCLVHPPLFFFSHVIIIIYTHSCLILGTCSSSNFPFSPSFGSLHSISMAYVSYGEIGHQIIIHHRRSLSH